MFLTRPELLKRHYKVLIVGGGPAGLAASNALHGCERDVLVVESGSRLEHRDHREQTRLTTGLGGAGLYSDGKFSFYPSATALWSLDGRDALSDAYSWLRAILGEKGIPNVQVEDRAYTVLPQTQGLWNLKDYPSKSVSLSTRKQIIENLIRGGAGTAVDNTSVTECLFDATENRFAVKLSDVRSGRAFDVSADFIIFATGRMGPIELLRYDFIQPVFKRLEVGFRIEQPASQAFFAQFSQLDPKVTRANTERGVEWRTFCACREGEIVCTNTAGIRTVSGRSDCPPSGYSNIGFNTRITNSEVAKRVWPALLSNLQRLDGPFRMSLIDLLSGKKDTPAHAIFSEEIVRLVHEGLCQLVNQFPSLASPESYIIGPSLEGVGWYPKIANDLSVPGVPACIVGDAGGLFRGVSGALISGYFCGLKYSRGEFRTSSRDTTELFSEGAVGSGRRKSAPVETFIA